MPSALTSCVGECCARHPRACTDSTPRARRFDSGRFWERRYARGGNSGAGSYGPLANYKAQFLNTFVAKHAITSVVEFGCGDGNQLALSMGHYPRYTGLDVSSTVVERLRQRFRRMSRVTFALAADFNASEHSADLALSLDVIFHLVEDAVFHTYMSRLVAAARRFAVIFSSNEDRPPRQHVRHRNFSSWLASHAPHPMGCSLRDRGCGDTRDRSFASFWVYRALR